jgi:hypothetical protein
MLQIDKLAWIKIQDKKNSFYTILQEGINTISGGKREGEETDSQH